MWDENIFANGKCPFINRTVSIYVHGIVEMWNGG